MTTEDELQPDALGLPAMRADRTRHPAAPVVARNIS
jgi:hypothetical protein